MNLLTKYKKQQIHILGATQKIEALQKEIRTYENIIEGIQDTAVTRSQLIGEALENAGIDRFYILNTPTGIVHTDDLIHREVMIDGFKVVVSLDLDTYNLLINNEPVNSLEIFL